MDGLFGLFLRNIYCNDIYYKIYGYYIWKISSENAKKSIGLNIKQKIISKDGGFDVHNDRGISTFFYSDFKKYYILEDLTWLKLHGNLLLVAKHDAFDSLNLENFIKSIKANIKS